ncbi:MAG: zinc-binding alcohol dehydrogenase family protein [Blastocatellia bacterium]|nr:zinc-binding alcohol dehydrogenase family protein [Blastocatellia bacterium]
MKAIILDQPGSFSAADIPEPQSVAGEAIVRISRIGMCGTDLHAYRGRQPFFTYPRILGHELCAEIVEIENNVAELQAGMTCSIAPYLYCGSCLACRNGKTNCCVKLQLLGVHVDGGLREFFSVPLHTLHYSSALTREQLALVEPLSIGAHAVSRAQLKPDETILVIGAGPIGLAIIAHANTTGVKVIVMDVSADRLGFAHEQFNVSATIVAGENILEQLSDLTNGEMPSVVFDATGNVASMNESFNYPANGGRLILVGLHLDFVTFRDQDFHRRELTVLSSRNATAADFQRTISLLETGRINIAPWVTHRVKDRDLIEQFPSWLDAKAGFIKAVVEWE